MRKGASSSPSFSLLFFRVCSILQYNKTVRSMVFALLPFGRAKHPAERGISCMETLAPPVESQSQLVSSRMRPNQFVVFRLNDQYFGLKLSCVQRVVRSAEITPLPNGPEIIPGIVNIQGEIVYVVNTRRALGLPDRELDLSDQFILASASGRVVALVSDQVIGVQEFENDQVKIGDNLLSNSWRLYGVAKTEHQVILILDLDRMIQWDQLDGLDRPGPGNDGRLLHG